MAAPFLHFAPISPVGQDDLEADRATSKFKPGSFAFSTDEISGIRLFKHVQARSTAGTNFIQGDVVSGLGDGNAITDGTASAGTTSTVSWVSTRADSSIHTGSIIVIDDDAGAAGAAPEGQLSVVIADTTALITIDPDMLFTTAPANSDSFQLYGTWNVEMGADLDTAYVVRGVVIGRNGFSNNNFGWTQVWGLAREVRASGAIAIGEHVKLSSSSAGAVRAASVSALLETIIGHAITTINSDVVGLSPIFLTLDIGSGIATTGLHGAT